MATVVKWCSATIMGLQIQQSEKVWPSLKERKAKLLVGEVVAYLASVEESFFSDESSASILAAPGVQSAHRACTRGMGHPSQSLA